MSRILDSFEVGKRALIAQQTVLNTVGHNLANAGTPGYTRQRVELVPARTRNGVEVQTIVRIRDRFLDFATLTESQNLGRDQARQGVLDRLEGIFNAPEGAGLGAALDQVFQAFEALSVSPTDQTVRVTLLDSAQRLASTFQGLQARIGQLKQDLNTQLHENVQTANGLLDQISELHRQIRAAINGGLPPNDLFDKRDQLVAQINEIIGVSATDRPDGTVQLAVSGSGVLLVDGVLTSKLALAPDPGGADAMVLTAGTHPITPIGGELAAALDARNSPTAPVKRASADLDSLAHAIIEAVNRVHASGAGLAEHTALGSLHAVSAGAAPLTAAGLPFTPTSGSFDVIVHDGAGAVTSRLTVPVTAGVTTLDDVAAAIDADPSLSASVSGGLLTISAASGRTFAFANDTSDALMALGLNVFFAGSSAGDMAVSPMVAGDVRKIAAARADAAGLVHPGDGANALAMAGLRTQPAMSGSTTFSDFFAAALGSVGSAAREAHDAVDRQEAALQVVQSMQQQTSGVSMDEELISLTQAQNAYAAAAKYIGTVQEMIRSLLDMVNT
jgi:flagellar hook-associated protein 1 FlgK